MISNRILVSVSYYCLIGLVVIFMLTHSPNLELDIDPSYINFGASRPPLYPIFLWLFKWAGPYQYTIIMWLQGILLISSLFYARFWLKNNLKLPELSILLIFLFVITTVSFHFQIWFIQSEGLAFPIFIFTLFILVDCFKDFNYLKTTKLSILVSLLILTRLQFYYFYAIFTLLPIWYLWKKIPVQKVVNVGLILIFSIISTFIIDHSYHYYKHGTFRGTSYGGLMLLVQTLYLSDIKDIKYFNDQEIKAIFKSLIEELNSKNLQTDADLLTSIRPSYLEYAYQSYAKNYLSIQDVIDDKLNASVEKSTDAKNNIHANEIANNINRVLIANNPKKNIVFLIWKFIECVGNVPIFIFYSIILLTSLYALIKNKIVNPDVSFIFITLGTIITLLNAGIVAVCNPSLPVYFCYTQFIFYCFAAIILNYAIHREII